MAKQLEMWLNTSHRVSLESQYSDGSDSNDMEL